MPELTPNYAPRPQDALHHWFVIYSEPKNRKETRGIFDGQGVQGEDCNLG